MHGAGGQFALQTAADPAERKPVVEIPHDDAWPAAGLRQFGKPGRLHAALKDAEAKMGRYEAKSASRRNDLCGYRATGLTRAEGEIVDARLLKGKTADDGVTVMTIGSGDGSRFRRVLAERFLQFSKRRRFPFSAGVDLLQRDDVGIMRGCQFHDAIEIVAAIGADTAVNIPAQHTQTSRHQSDFLQRSARR